jgi:drug/metabolite transporter (DMT)-like permease
MTMSGADAAPSAPVETSPVSAADPSSATGGAGSGRARLASLAVVAPLVTVCLWAGNTIVTRSAAGVVEPASMAFYRWLLAFAVLTPFLLPAVWRRRETVRDNWTKLAVLGVLGMALYQGLAYEAAKTTTAINMGVIVALMPLMAVLLAGLFAGEPPTARRIAGVGVSAAGLVVLVTGGEPSRLVEAGIAFGDGLMLIAVFSNALYGVLIKRWTTPLTSWQQLYVQIGFWTLFILPFWIASPVSPPTVANLPLILYAAIAASLLAPVFWIVGIRRLGASRATLFLNLLPPIVAGLAWGLLGEEIRSFHLVGGAVALIGVAIAL